MEYRKPLLALVGPTSGIVRALDDQDDNDNAVGHKKPDAMIAGLDE